MKKYFIPILVPAIICSCSDQKEEQVVLTDDRIVIDTLDATVLQPGRQSKDITIDFTNENGSKDTNGFYSGDTIYVALNYTKKNKVLRNNYKIGLLAKTKNISIRQLTAKTFRILIDPRNQMEAFQISPYIYSTSIVFTNAYHDTIDGFNKEPDGHSAGLTEYAFPIKDKYVW